MRNLLTTAALAGLLAAGVAGAARPPAGAIVLGSVAHMSDRPGGVWVAPAAGGPWQHVSAEDHLGAAWSAVRRVLAVRCPDGGLCLTPRDRWEPVAVPEAAKAVHGVAAWSANGKDLIFATETALVAAGDGRTAVLVRIGAPWPSSIVPSPDGRRIALIRAWNRSGTLVVEPALDILDLRSGRLTRVARAEPTITASWSPGGREVAYSKAGRVYLYDVERKRTRSLGRGNYPLFSPTSRTLVHRSDLGASRWWTVHDLVRGARRTLPLHGFEAAWSPDGQWLASLAWKTLTVARADGTEKRDLGSIPHGEPTFVLWTG